jgi:hypothetical protein
MQTERELATVIKYAVADAHRTGLDYNGEMGNAVRAVMRVRPDLDAPEALAVVDRFLANDRLAT